MNPGWIHLRRMPMRSEDDYEPMLRGVNLPIASVVKTTAAEPLNRYRLWSIVMGSYEHDGHLALFLTSS